VGGVNAGYAIAAGTRAPDDALALLRHLTDATALREWAATGRLPAVTRAAYAELLGQPQGYAALFYDADELQLYYDQLLSPALATRHKETTQALIALVVTPAEAAQQMAAAARQP
jgi:raffinose/stachyose/melibiose transport system substrate-binding protein